jgi:2-polyprenyl-6-methoxyphenol hydroxylase-like FAD-dependent oxidoreductase
MNDRTALPIAIVGAGIGGLAAALTLARQGYAVQVLEQASEFKEIGAGIQLGPNVFKMLDQLGLIAEVKQLAVFPDDLVMMDSVTGQQVTDIPLGQPFLDRFRYPYAVIHRADLHTVLLNAVRADARIALRPGCSVVGHADDGAKVTLTLEGGETVDAQALIGADGLWSRVRETIVGDGAPRVSGHIAYRAVLPIEDVQPELRRNAMVLWAGPKNHLVQYPLRGGKLYNLVAVFHSDRYVEGWNTQGDSEELTRRFAGTCETVRTLLSKIETWRMWVLCDREPVARWSQGRVTLLGDAAHPMLQYLAQGACMAIEDAVVLAREVATSPADLASAFQRYEQQRYLRTGRAQLSARLYGEFYHATGVARELRNGFFAGRSAESSYDSVAWIYDGI